VAEKLDGRIPAQSLLFSAGLACFPPGGIALLLLAGNGDSQNGAEYKFFVLSAHDSASRLFFFV